MNRFFFASVRSAAVLAGLGCAAVLVASEARPVAGAEVVWSIGTFDGRSIEFAPGSRPQVVYEAGRGVPSRDFPGHQEGSVGFDGRTLARPYTIAFELRERPAGPYRLALDLIYRSGAPRRIEIRVNDRVGIFPVRFERKKSVDGEEANLILLARQRLVVPIEGAWLRTGTNRVTIVPLGLGSLDYDALALERGPAAGRGGAEALRLEPTIFFRKTRGGPAEVCDLVMPFREKFGRADASARLGDLTVRRTFGSGGYDFGVWTEPIDVPVAAVSGRATVRVEMDGGRAEVVEQEVVPARQWRVFICPKVHNDVGYTDLQPHVNELDNRNTDRALDIMERFPFYKFNFETAWLVDNYLDCRPASFRERFFGLARRDRATINVLYLNLMTGVCSGEELYRALYFTERLRREHGTGFDFACLTDAPSHSWFLPSLLTDVGVRAFSNGSNQTRAPILHFSELNEDSPFWWEGVNGERVLFWFARSYTQWKRLTGPDFVSSAASYDYLQTSVPQFLAPFRRADYAPDAVMIYGAYVDNAAIPPTGEAELIEQWNREWEFPKLTVASDAEYFGYIEKKFGARLKTYRGDCGAYWEDGVASSAAQTALNRQSKEVLPAAETAHSLAGLFQPKERYPAGDFTRAWKNVMFYDEHTWGAHVSVSQPDREFVTRQWEVKESYASRANLDARNLLARGFNRVCQNIAVEGDTVLAFNWQNRARTAPLEVELNSNQVLVDPASGRAVPLDRVFEKDGWKRVRFLAENVPPMGYKGYAIRAAGEAAPTGNEAAPGDTIESAFYRLTVDTGNGGVKSLFDKRAGRELVEASAPHRLNQYVYVTGGEGALILNHTFGTPPARLLTHPPEPAHIVENVRTPLGRRLVVTTSCSNAPSIRSEYLLYDALRRVDIVNTVEKAPTRQKEACYFAFPFAAARPAFEYQIQNGWCRPNEDQLPGACREWFAVQNVVHLRDGDFDVAWATPDAPLVCLTDINRGRWPDHLPIDNGRVYSYVMHNYWFTNYRAEQGGTLRFRYSLTSGRDLGRIALAEFDSDTRAPVLAYPFVSSFSARVGGDHRPLPPAGASFLALDDPNLQVVTFKEAEDGDGWILRLREIAGKSGEARLAVPPARLKKAWLCNGVEVNLRELPLADNGVKLPYGPNRFVTVRFRAEMALAPARLATR